MAYWGNDPYWRGLSGTQRAAAMALMEAGLSNGRPDFESARNALGVMINRAARENMPLGDHVSGKIYQPTIEPAQYARLSKLMATPEYQQLNDLAGRRMAGEEADWVKGATHFLAPESQMLALEAKEPDKYKSWRKWTGFDPETQSYKGVVFRDKSHAFLAPEGPYSATFDKNGALGNPAQIEQPAQQMAQVAPAAQKGGENMGLLTPFLGQLLGQDPAQMQAQGGAPAQSGGLLTTLYNGGVSGLLDQAGKADNSKVDIIDSSPDAPRGLLGGMRPAGPDMSRLAQMFQRRRPLGVV